MISVVTWDAGFRESFHTVDCFNRQTIGKNEYEFIWVDFYSTINQGVNDKVSSMGNGRVLCYEGDGDWHLGRCINAAIKQCKGDLIVIPDGDVVVDADFLEEVDACHKENGNLALYFRRWDQPKSERNSSLFEFKRLNEECVLTNPTNYGGCLTLSKKSFELVRGYEEHELFSGAGASGMELYLRLKNAGLCIMWHPKKKLLHPWHEGTMPNDPEYLKKLDLQNLVMRKRDLNVSCRADVGEVDAIISEHSKNQPVLMKKKGIIDSLKRALIK